MTGWTLEERDIAGDVGTENDILEFKNKDCRDNSNHRDAAPMNPGALSHITCTVASRPTHHGVIVPLACHINQGTSPMCNNSEVKERNKGDCTCKRAMQHMIVCCSIMVSLAGLEIKSDNSRRHS